MKYILSIFGWDLQQKGLKGYKEYIFKEFVSNTLYSQDQVTTEYIFNEHKNNGNTFFITRIVEVDILDNILNIFFNLLVIS